MTLQAAKLANDEQDDKPLILVCPSCNHQHPPVPPNQCKDHAGDATWAWTREEQDG